MLHLDENVGWMCPYPSVHEEKLTLEKDKKWVIKHSALHRCRISQIKGTLNKPGWLVTLKRESTNSQLTWKSTTWRPASLRVLAGFRYTLKGYGRFHPLSSICGPRTAHSVLSAREPNLKPISEIIPYICNGGSWHLKSINYLIKMNLDLTFRDHLLRIKQIILSFILEIQIFEKIFYFTKKSHFNLLVLNDKIL